MSSPSSRWMFGDAWLACLCTQLPTRITANLCWSQARWVHELPKWPWTRLYDPLSSCLGHHCSTCMFVCTCKHKPSLRVQGDDDSEPRQLGLFFFKESDAAAMIAKVRVCREALPFRAGHSPLRHIAKDICRR